MQSDGASVVLLERGTELAWGCSAGNAGIVGASHVVPLADPSTVRDGIRWLMQPDSPFYVRPRPRVFPWLLRFAAAALPARERRNRAVLGELASHSAALHAGLEAAGLDAGYQRRGLLNVYRDGKAYARARGARTQRLARAGCERRAAQRADLRHRRGDPRPRRGPLRSPAVRGWRRRAGEGGKGYHVDVEARPGDPELPVWLHDSRVVITPMEHRLRLAGTLELTGTDRGVDARRVQAIVDAVRRALPGFGSRRTLDVWRGLRPCTPDGLPVIGRTPHVENAVLATGHGMWGLQLAPVTGRLVASIVAGEEPDPRAARTGSLPRDASPRPVTRAEAGRRVGSRLDG